MCVLSYYSAASPIDGLIDSFIRQIYRCAAGRAEIDFLIVYTSARVYTKPALAPGLPRYIAICDISRYFHIAIQTYMGFTEIDGRIDGKRRKSHSAAATSVGPHTYIRIPLWCCVHVHIYC